jgi:hypothetical protein
MNMVGMRDRIFLARSFAGVQRIVVIHQLPEKRQVMSAASGATMIRCCQHCRYLPSLLRHDVVQASERTSVERPLR